jgi:hypothetical protein
VRIARRGGGSVVTWRRAQMVMLSAQGMVGAADSVMHRDNGKEADTVQHATEATNSWIPHDSR